MTELAHRKYLAKYAEPEARFAAQLEQRYAAALVVPLHGEDASFLQDLEPALLALPAPARALLIVVVNATDAAPATTHEANERLLHTLSARLLPRQALTTVEGSPAVATRGRPGVSALSSVAEESQSQSEIATGTIGAHRYTYQRRRPERSILYQVVRDHLETLYAAVEDGFSGAPLPGFVRDELEGYLNVRSALPRSRSTPVRGLP